MAQFERLASVSLALRRSYGKALLKLKHQRSRSFFVRDVLGFVDALDGDFKKRVLMGMDPGRVISLKAFLAYVVSYGPTTDRVAVVSGSTSEPELVLLEGIGSIDFLNFNDNPEVFDLNSDWSGARWDDYRGSYDLVLCEQVLEHLPDPKLAVRNLASLLRNGGLLHVSAPSVNNYHGEPHYWFAGFATEALHSWLLDAGLSGVESSSWRSKKGSRMYSTSDWAPLSESGPNVFFIRAVRMLRGDVRKILSLALRRLRNGFLYPFQPLFAISPTRAAVVSWAFGANREENS